jgi:hypothetical protein
MVAGAEKLESEVVAVDPAAVVQEEAFGAEQVQEQVRILFLSNRFESLKDVKYLESFRFVSARLRGSVLFHFQRVRETHEFFFGK